MSTKKSTGSKKTKQKRKPGRPRNTKKTGKTTKKTRKPIVPRGMKGLESADGPKITFYWDKSEFQEEEREGLYESSLSGVHKVGSDTRKKMRAE